MDRDLVTFGLEARLSRMCSGRGLHSSAAIMSSVIRHFLHWKHGVSRVPETHERAREYAL